MIIRETTISFVLLFLLSLNIIYAGEQKFPSWMDEAKFETGNVNNSSFGNFNEPIDPETGKRTSASPKRRKLFNKPKLPDFKKFREKAMKAKIEKKASGTARIDSNIDFSLKNLSSLKDSENRLDLQIQKAASDIFKNTLLQQKYKLSNKIKALEEIKTLLSREKTDDPADVQSDDVSNRIGQLSSFIFNLQKMPSQSLTSPKPLTQRKKNVKSSNIPTRFYRPKPFRSFYQETKDKKDNEEK